MIHNNRHFIIPISGVFLCLGLVGLASCSNCESINRTLDESGKTVVILFENDVHCSVQGYTKIAGLRDAIVEADTAYVGIVSSGDFLQGGTWGAVSRGGFIVNLMNAVGYDVVTLGNHELDYKTPRLLELADSLNVPVVNVNFTDMKGRPYFDSYVIKNYGGMKIAFVGVLTLQALYSESYGFFDESTHRVANLDNDVYSLVQSAVDDARQAGANFVILLSHVGELDEASTQINSINLVQNTSGIDVVLDGHSHSTVPTQYYPNAVGKNVLLTQTGANFKNIGKLEIHADGKVSAQLLPTKDVAYTSSKVDAVYDSINDGILNLIGQVVAHMTFALEDVPISAMVATDSIAQSNLSDLLSDAYRRVAGAQIGFVNYGSIRAGLNAGDITYGDVVAVSPFGNDLCLLEVTGQQILDVLEITSDLNPAESGMFAQVSGLKFTIDSHVKNGYTLDSTTYAVTVVGERRVQNVQVQNADGSFSDIEAGKTYTVAVSSYVAYAGDEMMGFRGAKILVDKIMVDSDALLFYVRDTLGGTIPEKYAKSQKRIIVK